MIEFKASQLLRNNSHASLLKNENIIEKLKSHMTKDQMEKSPSLPSILAYNKRIRFNLLTQRETKINPITVKNEKKQRLINDINSFRKIYFNYNKNVRYSLNELNNRSKENSQFITRYKNMIKKSGLSNKHLFSDIKAEYEKQNYKLPRLDDGSNLFKSNLLLSNNDTDLKKFITYGYGSQKSNERSISFLQKMNEGIDNITKDENGPSMDSIFNRENPNIRFRKKFNYTPSLFVLNKMSKNEWKEILSCKRDIKKLTKTIDAMQDIDYFFDSDNKDYLDTLRYFNSRNSSANFSTSLGNNNSSIFFKHSNNNSNNNSNILNMRNISKFTFDGNESSIRKSKNKKVSFKINPKTINYFDANKNNENIENSPINKIIIKKPKKSKKIKKKYFNKDNYRKTLETLYNKITTTDDSSKFDKKIKSYLKFRRYILDPKINKDDICNNMEKLRDKICKDISIKKVIYFRKSMGHSNDEIEQINKNESEIEKKVYDIEDKMIKAFSELKK